MDYFELGNKPESEFRFMYDKTDTSEYFISKQAEGIKDFKEVPTTGSKQNEELKVESEMRLDSDGNLKLDDLEENLDENKILFPDIDEVESKTDKPLKGTLPVCRLCAQEIYDEEMTYLHETSSDDSIKIVDKINACLPITASLEDSLPKQICPECLVNVESSYLFSQYVIAAEEKLRHLQFSSNFENMNCPLCCEGCMEAVPQETNVEDDSGDEFSPLPDNNKVRSGQIDKTDSGKKTVNTAGLPNTQTRKRGRPRRSDDLHLDKDDSDWTFDQEIEPVRKKRITGSNRGRPKGSKNRVTKLKNMDCFICHSKFNDYEEALSHALSAHCDSVNETFPCPLCQSITTSEEELRYHIDKHSDKRELYVIRCDVCRSEFGQVTELHKHVQKTHMSCAKFSCSLCDYKDSTSEGLLTHVFRNHQDTAEPDLATCPVCTLVFQSEPLARQHYTEAHGGGAPQLACAVCGCAVPTEDDYLNHFMETHCAMSIYTIPTSYCCCVCNNNFRSQYHLIKHTCNVVAEELFCSDCDKGFPTKARYVFHLQTHHNTGQPMRCDECLATFTNEDTFYDHVRFQHEPDEQVQCDVCQKVFKNSLSLSMHMRRHQPNRDHECEEHYFDPVSKTGFIEYRLKTVRVRLSPSQKKYIVKKKSTMKRNLSFEEEVASEDKILTSKKLQEYVNWMKFKTPSTANRPQIEDYLKKTFHNRRREIMNGEYAGAILKEYPRLLDFNGDMIDLEFNLMYDDNDFLFIKFPEIRNKIMKYINTVRSDLLPKLHGFNDEDLKAILGLHLLLPQTNFKSGKKGEKNQDGAVKEKTKTFPPVELIIFKPECGKRFQNAQTLREHMVSHMPVKPFQCHICGTYLSRLSRLRIHLRTHSVKSSKASMKAYKCSICTQLFPNTKAAIKHSESHTDVQNINLEELEVTLVFRCEFCDACFQQTAELNTHRKRFHSDPNAPNAYTCSVCGAQFSTYARVTTHKLSHGINTETLIVPDEVNKGEETFVIPQYFLCHECDKRCLHYTYMSLHRRFQHASGKPIFTCSVCGDKFATTWSLQFHRKKQHNLVDTKDGSCDGVNSLYHCHVCDKPYVTETSLEHHVRKCHETEDGDDPGTNYMCETCGKTFQFKSALEAHADAHRGMKRFKCNLCEKRFTHRAGLIRHMKLHSETDTFECEFCGKKFRDRTERENHRRAHTGERPFMCDVCGRTFHTRAVWLDHSRIHQDVRPFQCDICSQSFRRSYALKSHYLIHTGERPFSCEVCGKTFRLKQTLFAHRKKEHQSNEETEQIILPDEVLLIEEDSQYMDDLPKVETNCESVMGKSYLDIELVNPEVPSSSGLDVKNEWQIDPKQLLNKNVADGVLVKGLGGGEKYSLLLKSQHSDSLS